MLSEKIIFSRAAPMRKYVASSGNRLNINPNLSK